ncbi:DUF402 domain-containing protein [Asanoa iriomotensis]|uniref:DUF402 domain-containing protein n=1 Tax=Asanoa iriomotensis TaxID=234613 RepID=A0ABQ4BYV8_9ACTN|nr:DUF402 domain-containing protein [Asanoa iriomotensis]GIF55708.1 hypothetical protein Air01nite_18030 [Asanoa iriomotensis]
MIDRFALGSVVHRREVLHGDVWLSMPVRVIADDDVLAVWLAEGTPLTFPPHPFGPHPWSDHTHWTTTGVLHLHRVGDAHAVWGFFRGDQLDHWYVNFQAPYHRTGDGFDTVDHGVDMVISEDEWHWKDRDDVAEQVRIGRLTAVEAQAVWAETERVANALDNGERWWLPRWSDWQPAD